MSLSEDRFKEILDELTVLRDAASGQWFSLPAIKINGKICAALWLNGDMVFKLRGADHARALALQGARLFQPLEDRNPMREWVQVPPDYADQWRDFAHAALEYVWEGTQAKKGKRRRGGA